MLSQHVETTSRLLAKLLRDLLAGTDYQTLADLTDALKYRCSRLRIRYTPDDVASALHLLAISHHPPRLDAAPAADPVVAELPPLTPAEQTRLYREILARFASEQPITAAEIPPPVDPALVARLSACAEVVALDYFWQAQAARVPCGARVDVRELLLLFEAVRIARPAEWDTGRVRAEFEARRQTWQPDYASGCIACRDRDELQVHHVITVQHGGSNRLRNFVTLCVACHRYLHPWLTDPLPRVRGFASFAEVFNQAGEKP